MKIDRLTNVNNRHITILYIFIQLMYNKNEHLFLSCLMSSLAYTAPSLLLDPRRPLHMLYMYMCIKRHFIVQRASGLGEHKKLKDISFIFRVTINTILSIVRTHAQKNTVKFWK